MKRNLIALLFFLIYLTSFPQEKEVLKLNAGQIESLFLLQNLELLAEQLNIELADAEIIQTKLWDNPVFSINDVNLWSTSSQREGEKEVIPPLFGSFGRNTEFSIELSQLIQTANKRNKLIGREQIAKEIAIQEFEQTLLGLKLELRKTISDISYFQSYYQILALQEQSVSQLIETYKKQFQAGNISAGEVLRLQSSLLEIRNEINELVTEFNDLQKIIKVLLNLPPEIRVEVIKEEDIILNPETISIASLIGIAESNRPDSKVSQLRINYYDKSLAYEKAIRVPDLTISAAYDRYGGVWKDYIGFGISIDLPFFNRNQGNIRAARVSRQQSIYQAQQQQNLIHNEIMEAYSNYMATYQFYMEINKEDIFSGLDDMLQVYEKNLLNRNISMLEYLDFMDAYKSTGQIVLEARKKLSQQFEELQYYVGTEIKE